MSSRFLCYFLISKAFNFFGELVKELVYKYYEHMNMIVATNHPLVRRMDK